MTKQERSVYMRQWRKEHPDLCRQYAAQWRHRNPHRVRKVYREYQKKWTRLNPGRARAISAKWLKNNRDYIKAWRRRNPERVLCQWKMAYALRRGTLKRPGVCSHCGCACKPEGHHFDYSKPLEVIWLCSDCHLAVHGKASLTTNTTKEKAKQEL